MPDANIEWRIRVAREKALAEPPALQMMGAGIVAHQAAELEQRLDELAALQEGWDSYGAYPMQPGIRERVTTLLGHLRGEPHVGLTASGGAYLFWGADEDVIIELEPGGTVTALIEDRDLVESARALSDHLDPQPCRTCGRPFTPDHDVATPGPTSRHPFMPTPKADL
jgi:hypothetical protein